MIWIVGGTHEVRELLSNLTSYKDVIVSVTTKEAVQFLPDDATVFTGAVLREDLDDFVKANDIDFIVDMTHPFATRISESLRLLSDKSGIGLVRYVRPQTSYRDGDVIYVDSYDECYKLLAELKGSFLFTTGSKNAAEFISVRGENRFIFRVLPVASTIDMLAKNDVNISDIIAMVGPFGYELNLALIKQCGVDYLVTKDSGESSGTDEKLKACHDAGITAIVISRVEESGISDVLELANLLNMRINNK